MFFNVSGPSNFLTIGFLHLGVEMDDNNITINCLIVPIEKLMNIPCVKVMQAITVEKDECYSFLEAIIQSRLEAPFGDIPLKICIIQVRSNNEKVINGCANISNYLTEKPKA